VQLLFRDDILEKANGNFASLAQARRSIRTYSSTPVEEDLIKEAVRLASSSPSVCNRQATSICCIMNKDLINDILKLQNGNRGFGHLVQCLLLVNVDIRAFQGANERNQCWVDGGLFSMSLLYAISYLGLVSCPLNWCVDENKSRQLRVLMSYGDNINTIMMVAVGHPEEQMIVPFSHRFSLAEIFTCIK
jgi:nitroreductase